MIEHDAHATVRRYLPFPNHAHIEGDQADSVRVVAEEIGEHEMIRH
jgi:hypothetical protein